MNEPGIKDAEGAKNMAWYVYLAHFGAGVFLANGVPHFVNGISGRRFQSDNIVDDEEVYP